MTALTPEVKARQKTARARAYRIREGIRNYIHTLGDVRAAWDEGDWKTLGYASWEAYLAQEFSADMVRLPAEQRQKAIDELRLSDMPNRAIAAALNVNEKTVRRDRAAANAAVIDGELVDPAAETPIVGALKQSLVDAEQRAEDHRGLRPGDGTDDRVGASVPGPEVAASGEEDLPPVSSDDPRPVPPVGRGSSHDNRMPDPDPERERERLRVRDLDVGRTAAARIVPDIQTAVVSIGVAVKLGEPDLITAEMVRACREAVDFLDAIFKGEA